MRSSIEQKEITTLDSSLREKIIECIYMENNELDVYDFSEGKMNKREALELYHDGTIDVPLYDGTFTKVEIERVLLINMATMHKEIRRYIVNMDSCRIALISCVDYAKSVFENHYSEFIDSLVKAQKSTFYYAFSKNGMGGLKNYTVRVNPTDVATFASGDYGVAMRKRISMLSFEQRIALSDLLVYRLNLSAYRRRQIELRYVKSGPTSIKFQMIWYRQNEKEYQ